MKVQPQSYPTLPEDPEPGEYQCPECRSRVTVNSDGREWGHKSRSVSGDATDCPRSERVGGGGS